MTLHGSRKRDYQREWERSRRKKRSGDRHVSPAKKGRFVAFDGEGFDRPDGSHCYALLQDSRGGSIENANGLSSSQCIRYLCGIRRRARGRVAGVSFAFDYDVNNIIKDLPKERLERLWKEREVFWGIYRIEWMPRKWFQVSERDPVARRTIKGTTVRVYDIYGFFQSGFVKACETWLGKRDADLRLVRKWKRRRPTFKPEDLPSLRDYNAAELRLMVRLTQALKVAFDAAGVPLTQFYGPGASATTFFGQIGAKAFIDRHQPPEVETAGRHAYFGGRIEVPFYGEIPGPLYRYDLNSAYPSAIVDLPNLARGKWVQDKAYRPDLTFSVYHVAWSLPNGRTFYPFPWRSPEGAIYFPPSGRA